MFTRGVMLARVRVPQLETDDYFNWIEEPPIELPHDARWYIDGSMYDGTWAFATRVGFAIVVVSANGSLLAYGKGAPPGGP